LEDQRRRRSPDPNQSQRGQSRAGWRGRGSRGTKTKIKEGDSAREREKKKKKKKKLERGGRAGEKKIKVLWSEGKRAHQGDNGGNGGKVFATKCNKMERRKPRFIQRENGEDSKKDKKKERTQGEKN
jgi:hypothetical protein